MFFIFIESLTRMLIRLCNLFGIARPVYCEEREMDLVEINLK